MRLKRIELVDFRPFFGEQYLDFSEDQKRNLTLIHAQNGQGKTTLLNALLWAFHGRFTGNFREPDLLINKEALRAGRKACKVGVHFDYDGREYRVVRHATHGVPQTVSHVYCVEESGDLSLHPQQQAFIEQVFPANMASYFFFDGEYAENFANSTRDSSVYDAIRHILGCTAAEHAIDDLEKLESRVHRQIKESTSNVGIRELENRREVAEKTVQTNTKEIAELKGKQVAVERLLRDINARLAEIAASAMLQQQRENASRNLRLAVERRKQSEQTQARWLTEGGQWLVGRRVSKVCDELYKELSRRAEIPAPYNQQFVQALISSHKCICGRDLQPGSPEMMSVTSLLSGAAEAESLRRLVRVRAFTQSFDRKVAKATSDFVSIQRQVASAIDDISRFEREVDDLTKKLGRSPVAEVAEREKARSEKIAELQRLTTKERNLVGANNELREEIRKIDLDLDKKRSEDAALGLLSKRLRLLVGARESLQTQLDDLQRIALKSISEDTNKLLAAIIRKSYTVQVGEDYSLTLLDERDEKVPASSGEAQLLSLAFLASLIRFCAQRQRDANVLLTPGTVAPFVLDSPFGQLDPVYKEGAAKFLPQFADQVVLMLSASQGDQSVLTALKPAIGSECALVQHNSVKRPAGDTSVEKIVVDGRPIVVTYWDSPPTRTEIENLVYHGARTNA